MLFRKILPLVEIQLNRCRDRKAIVNHLRKLGYDTCQPSTVSRCLLELEKGKQWHGEEIKKKRKLQQVALEIQLLKVLDDRKILLSDAYFQKVFGVLQDREKNLDINKETAKILIAFAKKGKLSWNAFFSNLDEVLGETGPLDPLSVLLEVKRYIDRNSKKNITVTFYDVKKALPCLKTLNWELFHCYYSLMVSIRFIEKSYLNRSEAVLFLTGEINKRSSLSFRAAFKPRDIKQALENLARRELLVFPDSYTARTKKKVSVIYRQSQQITSQLLTDPAGKNGLIPWKSRNPGFQLLNRIITTHFHEFYESLGVNRTGFFHWWHAFGKQVVNVLQHGLLLHGRHSELYSKLVTLKTLQKDEIAFYQELKQLTGISEQQLVILVGREKAKTVLITLITFLTKYFLGANHFRLRKGERGFIPLYRNDPVQLKFDAFAEGLHMGNFLAVERLREGKENNQETGPRQRRLFMDIFLGELLEACIVNALTGTTAPATLMHIAGGHVVKEMAKQGVTGKMAALLVITAIKRSVSAGSYQQALQLVGGLLKQVQNMEDLEYEVQKAWSENICPTSGMNHVDGAGGALVEQVERKIDELLLLGKQLLFPEATERRRGSNKPSRAIITVWHKR
ncbi:MAG: hypothetical protein ACFFD4_12475 [Candidatus Odinarchaeota archaeon]